MLAGLLLMLPLQWVCAVIVAIGVHEFFHGVAILLCHGTIQTLSIGARGITMETSGLSGIRESISALAGPIGSFALILLARWFPRVAICGLVHGVYNLIPVFPLDGGRVLRGILYSLLPTPMAASIFSWIQRLIICLLALFWIWILSKAGFIMALLGFFLLPRFLFGGTIGKISKKRYGYDRFT